MTTGSIRKIPTCKGLWSSAVDLLFEQRDIGMTLLELEARIDRPKFKAQSLLRLVTEKIGNALKAMRS